jgi:dTMP kinase
MDRKGKYIVIDGIDGSGKSTRVKRLADYLTSTGKSIFDLIEFSKNHDDPPQPEELFHHDIILANEPTYFWAGKAIRKEAINAIHNRHYEPRFIAEGYSFDRGILDTMITIPLLNQGVNVIKDRALTTTLVYQTSQGVPLDFLLSLEGNKIALSNPPDAIVIADCPPEVAIERLRTRLDKNDNAIFEKLEFLKKADAAFKSDWFRDIFESRGTRIIYLNTARNLETEVKELIGIYNSIVLK